MSDSSIPEYILRKPYELPNGDKWIDVSWDDFDELFVPLDRQALTEQLETVIRNAILNTHSGELTMADHDEITYQADKAVAKVLALFGLENTGEENK